MGHGLHATKHWSASFERPSRTFLCAYSQTAKEAISAAISPFTAQSGAEIERKPLNPCTAIFRGDAKAEQTIAYPVTPLRDDNGKAFLETRGKQARDTHTRCKESTRWYVGGYTWRVNHGTFVPANVSQETMRENLGMWVFWSILFLYDGVIFFFFFWK